MEKLFQLGDSGATTEAPDDADDPDDAAAGSA
jgi:hypothetical protein